MKFTPLHKQVAPNKSFPAFTHYLLTILNTQKSSLTVDEDSSVFDVVNIAERHFRGTACSGVGGVGGCVYLFLITGEPLETKPPLVQLCSA